VRERSAGEECGRGGRERREGEEGGMWGGRRRRRAHVLVDGRLDLVAGALDVVVDALAA